MARYVGKQQCPRCAEVGRDKHKDNLGVYDDGSKYCFSCGYTVSGSKLTIHNSGCKNGREPTSILSLPTDVEPYYRIDSLEWINKYELTRNDLYANKALWSEQQQRLIFPFYNEDGRTLLAWQGRYFGPDRTKPKWRSYGKLDTLFHIFNRDRSRRSLVLVEDIISAIKIGRVGHSVMPLFGSYVSDKKLCHLKLITDSLCLFLDPDKYKYSVELLGRSMALGLPCRVISADRDPKEIEYEQLTSLLN